MPFELGSVLNGRYRLRRLLGQGSLGAVYLADDENDGNRPCVVKEYLGLVLETQRLFRHQAGLLASQHHPNLPRVFQHFSQGDGHYLVMDYVPGESLQQRLDRAGPQSEAQVLAWAAPLCEVVRYLHSLVPPVLHRALQPANLMLTPEGGLVLVGFGLPRPIPADPQANPGLLGLTPGYAPPEQYGMGRMDARLDQYGLAATLYALLVGHPPPDGLQRLAGRAPFIRPRALRPELNDRIDAALTRGLEVQPEARFPDIAAFSQALLGAAPAVTPAPETASAGTPPPTPAQDLQAPPVPPVEATPAPAVRPIVPATPPPPRPAAHPTIAVTPVPAASSPPVPPARPRPRVPLYLVIVLVVVVLAVCAILLGSVAGAYLSGRLATSTATEAALSTRAVPATVTVPATATIPAVVAAPTETPSSVEATAAPTEPLPPATLPPPAETAGSPTTAAGTPVGGGGRLAFISNRDGQHYQLFTMNPDGSDVRQLTSDPTDKWDPNWTFGGTQLAWSPDGTRLVYVAASPAGDGTDLFMIDAAGSSAPVNLTAAAGDDFHPAWCGSDGLWFTSLRANNTHQIFSTTLAQALDGQRPTNQSGTHNFPREYDPSPLPDGDCQRWLFVTTLQGYPEIWRYFLDCANCYRVVRTERDSSGAAEEPALSADGVYLAYTRRLGDSAEIVVGEVLDRLVNVQVTDTGRNFQPQFSPDGQWLVFTSERDGNRDIFIMARDGSSQTNLTFDPATDTDPVWQPVALP